LVAAIHEAKQQKQQKTHLPALPSWEPSCKNPSFADCPWWWPSAEQNKKKIYRLPPQAVDKGFADKKIRKKINLCRLSPRQSAKGTHTVI
jgi:hypothetical protein